MSNRNSRKPGNNRRAQTPKSENKEWMRARLVQSNSNLTRPSGKVYKRPAPGSGGY